MKKKIIIGITILLLIVAVIVLLVKTNDNNKNGISNEKVITEPIKVEEKEEMEGLVITDTRIVKSGKQASLFLKIKNATEEHIKYNEVVLTALDKDENVILEAYITGIDQIEPGFSSEYEVPTDEDLSKVDKYILIKRTVEY